MLLVDETDVIAEELLTGSSLEELLMGATLDELLMETLDEQLTHDPVTTFQQSSSREDELAEEMSEDELNEEATSLRLLSLNDKGVLELLTIELEMEMTQACITSAALMSDDRRINFRYMTFLTSQVGIS